MLAGCLFHTPWLAAGQEGGSGDEPEPRTLALLCDRAEELREDLPLRFGIPIAPGPAGQSYQLLHRGRVLEAEFERLGQHPDGSTGFLGIRALDPGRGGFDLLVDATGERGEPARDFVWEAPPAELRSLPWRAALLGAEGARIEVELATEWVRQTPLGWTEYARADFVDPEAGRLASVEAWVRRLHAAPLYATAEVVLRNDDLDDARGALRFADLELWVDDPEWARLGAAWARSKGTSVERTRAGARLRLFGGLDNEALWLGDFQGCAWRVVVARREFARERWVDLLHWNERPSLLIAEPRAQADSGWYGSSWGAPFGFAPDAAIDERNLARLRWGWESGWSGARADTKYSASTGSERVGPLYEPALRFWQSGERRYYDLILETGLQQALRPFPRDFVAAEHPAAWLWDGRPRNRSGADLLGRDRPRALPREWNTHREFVWLDEWHGWNGFDWEHLTLEPWYELYLRSGSPWARRELRAVGEALATYAVYSEGAPFGNSRSFGWMLRAFAQLHALDGDERWLEAGARMVRAALNSLGEAEQAWLSRIGPDARGLGDAVFEYPWHLAVALWGLDAYLRRDPPQSAPALELCARLADTLAGPCFDVQSGLFKFAVSPDDPQQFRLAGPSGTLEWIPGALVSVSEHYPEERSELWVQRALLHGGNLWQRQSYELSGATWAWWQPVVRARALGFSRSSDD